MVDDSKSQEEKAAREHRFREALTLHEIEGNPLDAEDIAMFEMFESEGWSHEQCRAYMAGLAKRDAEATFAAE